MNSLNPEEFELRNQSEPWKEILKEKTTNPVEWIGFVEKNRNDRIGKFLPELIEKLSK